MRAAPFWALALVVPWPALASWVTGCSSSSASRVEQACDPGSRKDCRCDNGDPGTALCVDAGAYAECSCSPGSGGSGGSGGNAGGGGTAGDASTDGGGNGCVLALVAGNYDTCALLEDGSVWCWGGGSASPSQKPDLGDVVELASGGSHKCARRRDGSVSCWGTNTRGELGDDTGVDSATPVRVVTAEDVATFLQITAGGSASCARAAGGSAWCWGENGSGQTGDGTTQGPRLSPVAVTIADSAAMAEIVAAGGHTCVRTLDNSLKCWGGNLDGALGDGTPDPGPILDPVNVALSNPVVRTSGRCAITSDLALFCWGLNSSGQVGDGSTELRNTPVQVTALGNDVVEVTRTHARTCARKQDGSAWCWGRTGDGGLGDGTLTGQPCPNGECKPTPVRVSNLTDTAAIAAGVSHACAAKNDGTIWCWGADGQGQLGDGDAQVDDCAQGPCSSAPVQTLFSCP
jgi:hypothetical protein